MALPAEERTAYLEEVCAGDPNAQAELESLLFEAEGADHFFEELAGAVISLSPWIEELTSEVSSEHESLAGRLVGQYRIEEVLTEGGMGTVYAALDLKHDRRVAIKTVRPDLTTPEIRDRFQREIKITAQLQHPNILPLLDSGTAGEAIYYVMPFVEGETLRATLKRDGSLPVQQAVGYAEDVAAALDHAHGKGVIHRDIKPENILVTAGKAIVADFGISKALSERGGTAVAREGYVLGTPDYMAPEQHTGEVTPKTDIYALGCVLYEALTGRKWLSGAVVDQADWTGVDQASRTALTRALEPSPEIRWENAAAFGNALGEAGRGGLLREIHRRSLWLLLVSFAVGSWVVRQVAEALASLLGLPLWFGQATVFALAVCLPFLLLTGVVQAGGWKWAAAPRSGFRQILTWRNAALGGVGVFALLGLGTAGYLAMRGLGIGPAGTLIARNELPEDAWLVLADFAGAPEDSALARTVTEALRIDLSQSPAMTLAEPGQIRQVLGQMERPEDAVLDLEAYREVAIRGGMAAVIAGAIRRVGEQYVLTAQVVSAEGGKTLVSRRETAAGEEDIIPALDGLSTGLRERIGESLKTIRASPPLEAVTTSSLKALQKYAEAQTAMGVVDRPHAIALLEEAVALDPGFAMAWRKLGVLVSSQSRSRGIEAITKAFEHRDRLTDRERYLVTGTYYGSRGEADRTKAIQAYRTLLESYPDDAIGNYNLAALYASMRDYAAAETLNARVTRLDPWVEPITVMTSWHFLAMNEFAQGKFEEARATLERRAELHPDHRLVRYNAIGYAASLGDYEKAEAEALAVRNELGASEILRSWAEFALASLYMVRGRLTEAERSLRAVIAADEQLGLTHERFPDVARLALMEAWHRGNEDGALLIIEEELDRYPIDSLPVLDRPYADLATIYAFAGRPVLARDMLIKYEATIPADPQRGTAVYERSGDVAFAEGRYTEAISEYRLADRAIPCQICVLGKLGRAYDAAGQPDSAIAVYERYVTLPWLFRHHQDRVWLAFTFERLGALYDDRGDLERAALYYAKFVELWQDADPELQPRVRAAQERLDEIMAERG
jgi:tetratricopeptide (TPR) repeat protein